MERMTAAEFRREFGDGGIRGAGNPGAIRQNNARPKAQRRKLQTVQNVLRAGSNAIHAGPFRIEIEIFGKCRADIDNVLKGVLDALNGVAYVDDKKCVEARVKLHQS